MSTVLMENNILSASFDESTGALVHLRHKQTGWAVQNRERLARSFAVVAPLPERLLNVVDGTVERVRLERDGDISRLTFVCKGLQGPHCGKLDITLAAVIELSDEGLLFQMTVENNSPYVVESLSYPSIGDLGLPPKGGMLARMSPKYCTMITAPLYPYFPNERGYWGTDYPMQMVPTPESPFLLIQGEQEGLYIGCHDTSVQERTEFTFELKPGYSKVGKVPEGGRIGNQLAHIECAVMHLPFVQPGETISLAPIAITPYTGDWHAGADVYRTWRKSWMARPAVASWVEEVHSWQQLQMTSWGDSLRTAYKDLIAFGEECVRNGVTAIQLVGWTLYGQDGRLPDHATDPRLGTREELKLAIRKLQDMGLKVILYEKYSCADVTTDWYKSTLHRYASKDAFGNTHGHGGWRYHTPAHLAGINTRPYAWMCMHSTDWQDVALSQIKKSLELEPAGVLLDECQWHGENAFYCFDANHGHRVPSYNFGGDGVFEKRVRGLLEESGGHLVLAGEGPWDLQYRHYDLAYHRANPGHLPVTRYLDPFLPMVNWVYGYDDRESINFCLLYRYTISYEPMNFKGHLEEFPLTLDYGKRVDSLRRRYRDYLWDAEFRDTMGATIEMDTSADSPPRMDSPLVYSVFRKLQSGLRAIVIANHDETESVSAKVRASPELQGCVLVSPEKPEPVPADRSIQVPPRSVVVLLEVHGG